MGFCGSSSQHIRCCPILPHRGEEFYEEGFLVAVFGAELSGTIYRSAETAGRTAPGGRTSHEGLSCPAMWPVEPIPSSYFGLVKRIVGACPRLDAIKRSVCIEGARMAFAHAKVHWGSLMQKS